MDNVYFWTRREGIGWPPAASIAPLLLSFLRFGASRRFPEPWWEAATFDVRRYRQSFAKGKAKSLTEGQLAVEDAMNAAYADLTKLLGKFRVVK